MYTHISSIFIVNLNYEIFTLQYVPHMFNAGYDGICLPFSEYPNLYVISENFAEAREIHSYSPFVTCNSGLSPKPP
jgi:hypothetical protein